MSDVAGCRITCVLTLGSLKKSERERKKKKEREGEIDLSFVPRVFSLFSGLGVYKVSDVSLLLLLLYNENCGYLFFFLSCSIRIS